MYRILIITMLALPMSGAAQHGQHMPAGDTTHRHHTQGHAKPAPTVQDTPKPATDPHAGHNMPHDSIMAHAMTHQLSLSLPMTRTGSGTAWQPDTSPLYAYMRHSSNPRSWQLMHMYNLFVRYTWQDVGRTGQRAGEHFDAPNWYMLMGQKRVGQNGLFGFNAMISLDPLTVGGNGYPLLFQSGETYQGRPLVDRQHPHDLFSQLSVSYAHRFSPDVDAFLYLGYPGEPALSVPAFMHRVSTLNNPDSPLGHHWQDATHITFGVATAGLRWRWARAEVSRFTGREPDEERYGFDRPRFDSWSYRLSVNPSPNLALQFSQAWIKSPEAIEPDADVNRTTASAVHSAWLGPRSYLYTTAVWGLNQDPKGHHPDEHSALMEHTAQLDRLAVYGRVEWIQKSAEELALDETTGLDHDTRLDFSAVTLGSNYIVARQWNTELRLGVQATYNTPDEQVRSIYGDHPWGLQVYLRLTPGLLRIN